ncbi:DNA N-6-adenine-methyltransferase [Alkalihalobacillus pseudalcaliphilus]|uniref:DNA N-6-adenine-methyltransferase n=1 Tax=Alkalihalobacillus pseudalcaliphilus TaxID=79884 RepID=UPI00064DB205|nr:DNA N-6-adenine-methyltransferase [Alkalihalobacillus pseudalcaliphilus]KMK75433.1 adenine methyltransferase [Alkalihalobacillus pseudalcaliphilus]
MFSSATDKWATPPDFFAKLDAEFNFMLDAAADATNAKCARYFTAEDDGLTQDWAGETVWLNPPYGRGITGKWMRKAYEESRKGATVVCLVPARTDTRWFHDYVLGKSEIRFVKGRLKFGGSKSGAPFPSIVVIYRGETI